MERLTPVKRSFCKLSFLWILVALPLAASTSRIWVLNYTGNTVDVIDPVTNKVVQSIDTILRPSGGAISPDGTRAYITSETSEHNLVVVDTKTGKIISKVLLSGRPNLPAVTKDGKLVAVCIRQTGAAAPLGNEPAHDYHPDNEGRVPKFGGGVDIIDAATLRVVKTVTMDVPMHDCFTSPDSKYVVGGSPEGKFAAVIDLQTKQLAWEIPFDSPVFTMAMEAGADGSTRRIFVTLEGWNGFAVVDFATHKEVARIKFPEIPVGFTTDVMRNKGTAHGSVIAPDGKSLWIANRGSSAVFAYSLPDLKLLGHVSLPLKEVPGKPAVGAEQDWLTLTADSKTVYVSNSAINSVSAIDTKTMKQVALIPVGKEPKRVATEVTP
jgi:YVTN family beta-propeller protein